MNIGAILFFRMNSKRLPGKSLMKLGTKTLLEIIYSRALLIKGLGDLVVATSNEKSDNEIESKCNEMNIKVFRGSLNNVARRALDCALEYKMDYFIRICGDRPFFDYKLASQQVQICHNNNYDLVTNCFPKTYPSGMDSEILRTKSLKHNIINFNGDDHDEHLTKFFYDKHKLFKIYNLAYPKSDNISGENLSIDTLEDFNRINYLIKSLKEQQLEQPSLEETINILQTYKKNIK